MGSTWIHNELRQPKIRVKAQAEDGIQADIGAKHAALVVHNYVLAMVNHDLTIDGLHTYYVVAGSTPILVHNCGPDGLIDLETASQSGATADKGGYTVAGRALQKHAGRAGTGVNWPRPSGVQNPAAWNEAGQSMLDEILTNPNSITQLGYGRIGGTWQDTLDVRLPSGLGARFDLNGSFSGFLD